MGGNTTGYEPKPWFDCVHAITVELPFIFVTEPTASISSGSPVHCILECSPQENLTGSFICTVCFSVFPVRSCSRYHGSISFTLQETVPIQSCCCYTLSLMSTRHELYFSSNRTPCMVQSHFRNPTYCSSLSFSP